MKACLRFIVTAFGLLLAYAATAGEHCPQTGANGIWSADCFENKGTERRIIPKYLNRIEFSANGMAVVVIDRPRETVAIDRRGLIVIPGIHAGGDSDWPGSEEGISRFSMQGEEPGGRVVSKCGYFRIRELAIITPARYDSCKPFFHGKAQACTNCQAYCALDGCHKLTFIGGEGFSIGADGKVEKTFTPPSLENACETGKPPAITGTGDVKYLKCGPSPSDPFNHLK